MNLFSFFFPQKISQADSSINGKIEVVEQFGKKSIRVEGLEQSGPMVEKIWEKGLAKTPKLQNSKTPSCLILGLGGGSAVKIINKYFPEAKILGIEIDSVMIELGKKYLNLSEYKNLEIKITDAFKWVQKSGGLPRLTRLALGDPRRMQVKAGSNHQTRFDLILIDLYLGRKVPEKMKSEKFLSAIKKLLTNKGTVIFNFLRTKEKKLEFQEFFGQLKKVYRHIKIVKPVANYLIIAQ